jgi:hypothetical protein
VQSVVQVILEELGLWQNFIRGLSERERRRFYATIWGLRMDPPEILLSAAAQDAPGGVSLKSEIDRAWEEFHRRFPPVIPTRDWCRLYAVALMALMPCYRHVPEVIGKLLDLGKKQEFAIGEPVLRRASRIDQGLFKADVSFRRGSEGASGEVAERLRVLVKIDYAPARPVQMLLDGAPLVAYQHVTISSPAVKDSCPPEPSRFVWTEWSASLIPGLDGPASYPVYVEGSVYDQLWQRLDLLDIIEHRLGAAAGRGSPVREGVPASIHPVSRVCGPMFRAPHNGVRESLHNPRITGRSGGGYLIDLWAAGEKHGYFIAQIVENVIVVRGFLLITMGGTPEGDLLQAALKLQPGDLQRYQLDRWSTYYCSDIPRDRDLVDLLTCCGCGALLPAPGDPFSDPHSGLAAQLRRSAGLGAP